MKITRTIQAPRDAVFQTIANPGRYADAVPEIKHVEYLSEQSEGEGTRFRETREMFGKEVASELMIAECVANERIRFVSESGGTVWDSCFHLGDQDGGTALTLEMKAETSSFVAKLMNVLMAGMIKKAVGKDMAAVKAYCESGSGAVQP